MNLKKFEQALDKCEALANYPKLTKEHEKLREENQELKRLKLKFRGKPTTLDKVYKKLRKEKAEIKKIQKQVNYWKTLMGLEGNLDDVPPETLIKVLKNVSSWLKEKGWTLETSDRTLSNLLNMIIYLLEKKFQLGLFQPTHLTNVSFEKTFSYNYLL